GDDGYLQRFPIYSISTASAKISLAGKEVSDEDYFARVNGKDISWTQNDGVSVEQINKGDNFRNAMREYSSLKENTIIFVDPSFATEFHRFQPYFSRPSRVFDKDKGYNKVFILAPKASRFHIVLNKKVDQKELANVAGKIEGQRKDQIVVFS